MNYSLQEIGMFINNVGFPIVLMLGGAWFAFKKYPDIVKIQQKEKTERAKTYQQNQEDLINKIINSNRMTIEMLTSSNQNTMEMLDSTIDRLSDQIDKLTMCIQHNSEKCDMRRDELKGIFKKALPVC